MREIDRAIAGGRKVLTVVRRSGVFREQRVAGQLGFALCDGQFAFVLSRQLLRREAQVARRVDRLAASAERCADIHGPWAR
eukprot:3136499-Pleurochrysis_carterae.AAC.1